MPTLYRRADLHEDIAACLYGAVAFGAMAVIPFALLGAVNLGMQIFGSALVPWLTYAALGLMIALGYLLGATTTGLAVFLLRPLRAWWVGWILTGAIGAVCVYGSMFAAIAIMWNPAGKWVMNLQEHHSVVERADIVLGMPLFAVVFGGAGAVFGLYLYFSENSRSGTSAA